MSQVNPNRYIAFSGGGWNSHTASSGWVAGALKALKNTNNFQQSADLKQLFSKTNGFAANSGGGWFLSMLGFSKPFEDAITNTPSGWFDQNGYMGKQKEIFVGNSTTDGKSEFSGSIASGITESIFGNRLDDRLRTKNKILNLMEGITVNLVKDIPRLQVISMLFPLMKDESGLPSWQEFNKNIVFSPFGMNQNLDHLPNAERNKWAEDKNFIYQIAAPSIPTIVGGNGIQSVGNSFHSSYIKSSTPKGSEVTSAYLQSMPGGVPPQLIFNTGQKEGNHQEFDAFYGLREEHERREISGMLESKLSVIDGASITSAAVALLASPKKTEAAIKYQIRKNKLLPQFELINSAAKKLLPSSDLNITTAISGYVSRFLKELAIPASITEAEITPIKNLSLNSGNPGLNQQVYRLLDGGYVDNLAVTSAVHSIQNKSDMDDQFVITILSNSSGGTTDINGKDNVKLNVTSDVANLFGKNDQAGQSCQIKERVEGDGLTLTTIKPAIFKANAWDNTSAPDWNYQEKGYSSTIDYYRLDVETIDNECFGIEGGQKGELNIFNNVNVDSDTAPSNPSIFNEYGDLYNTLINGISGSGAPHALYSLGFAHNSVLPKNSSILSSNFNLHHFGNNSSVVDKNTIQSKRKKDLLIGSEGPDVYQFMRRKFSRNQNKDRNLIQNFDPKDGDQIDLSRLEKLEFIDSRPFSAPNQVRWNGHDLKINIIGGKLAEMSIKLVDFGPDLAETDLIL